jgi:hypothetical protein
MIALECAPIGGAFFFLSPVMPVTLRPSRLLLRFGYSYSNEAHGSDRAALGLSALLAPLALGGAVPRFQRHQELTGRRLTKRT